MTERVGEAQEVSVEQLREHIPDREKDMDNGAEKQSIACVHRTENSRWGAM